MRLLPHKCGVPAKLRNAAAIRNSSERRIYAAAKNFVMSPFEPLLAEPAGGIPRSAAVKEREGHAVQGAAFQSYLAGRHS